MENMKKWMIAGVAVTLCLAIALTACLLQVHFLSVRLTDLEQQHQRLFEDAVELYGELRGLRVELEEMDREANSLLDEMDYIITGAGTQPHTVAYRMTLVLKEVAQDTAVELTVGDAAVPFIREGNAFTGIVEIPLFEENDDYPVLTVTSAGITKRDELEEINLWCVYTDWLPELFESMNGIEDSDTSDSIISLAYGFRSRPWYTDDPVTFTRITMTRTLNGEEVLSEDVTDRQCDAADEGFTEVFTEFPVNKEDRVSVVIRAEDSLGYIHELETRCRYDEEYGSVVAESGLEQIYAPDGTPLYTVPFEEII